MAAEKNLFRDFDPDCDKTIILPSAVFRKNASIEKKVTTYVSIIYRRRPRPAKFIGYFLTMKYSAADYPQTWRVK